MDHPPPPQDQARKPGIESDMTLPPDFGPRFEGAGRLAGKVALISGGDSETCRATAVLFAREGARIAILYKDEHEDADRTLRLIRAEGQDGVCHACDIGNKAAVETAVAKVLDHFGRINVLVNNSAEQHVQDRMEDISEDQLKRTFATNIFGTFYLTQCVLPQMRSGDTIVNITSITALRGQDQMIDHASTKGAVLAFTRAMASKLADKGLRVNAVAPGPMWTPLILASFPSDKVKRFGRDAPLGRPGQPNEVAPSILFLACDDSSDMTGQTLHPYGGILVGR